MSDNAATSATCGPQSLSVRRPRLLWVGLASVALLALAVLLPIGLRLDRRIAAIQTIENHGGAVGTVGRRSGWQRSLFRHPTYKAFEVVDFVNWENGVITDDDVTRLLEFRTLTRLNLRHTRIHDESLVRLKELPHLKLLLLEGSTATDFGIDQLQEAFPGLTVRK